jgi:hypothetical protein
MGVLFLLPCGWFVGAAAEAIHDDFVHSAANCAGADHADAEGADGALEDGGRHGELKEREC